MCTDLEDSDWPVGNLLFLGPTGSGKTYVVEVVAEALFGDRRAFLIELQGAR